MVKNKVNLPVDAVIAVTYRCNSRCRMCNIWQIQDFPEISAEHYSKLPKTLRDINISGGEPFLRHDLSEIIRIIKKTCPKARINISTNGFLTHVIKKTLPEIKKIDPNIAVSISVDGIGQMHEHVRRVKDAWPKVVETINFCRSIAKIKHVKLAYTLNNLNLDHLSEAYKWSQKMDLEFSMAIAHSSDFFFGQDKKAQFFNDKKLKQEFQFVIKKLLAGMNPKDWVRAYFVDGLLKIATGKKRPLEPFSGQDFFYLDPKGDVYPSVIDNVIMGNILDVDNFEQLWFSSEAQKARDSLLGFENNYWMVCTARTAIKRNPLKVANWIFQNKLKWRE